MKLNDNVPFALRLNDALTIFFREAFYIALKNPRQALSFLRTLRWLVKAARLRADWLGRGVPVPPIIIFSITSQCNLHCKGCYARSFNSEGSDELSADRLRGITAEAKELGVSFFVLAGGEPFMRPEILSITADSPELLFLVFTNGVLISDDMLHQFKRARNLIPLLSLDGGADDTDARRGEGNYAVIRRIMATMCRAGLFFGTSLTLTRDTFSTITDVRYIEDLVSSGCKLFLFLDYTPTEEGTEGWVLSDAQRAQLTELMRTFRRRFPALFIAVPWDEIEVGGCLAAGRGFIHINAHGDIEPCPFAPFSETSVRDGSLATALQSEFLRRLRASPELIRYTGGGCALWKNRERVRALLDECLCERRIKGTYTPRTVHE